MTKFKEADPNTLVCAECGSDKIEQRAWIQVNTKKFMDWYDESDRNCYCPNCGLDGQLTTLLEFVKRADEINNPQKDEDEIN